MLIVFPIHHVVCSRKPCREEENPVEGLVTNCVGLNSGNKTSDLVNFKSIPFRISSNNYLPFFCYLKQYINTQRSDKVITVNHAGQRKP